MKRRTIILALALVLVVILSLAFTSCNENLGIGTYSFKHVHFSDGLEGHCATVNSWHNNEIGVEVHTAEYGTLYLSEGTYTLVSEGHQCPFCH